MGKGTFRDTLLHTKSVFFVAREPFLRAPFLWFTFLVSLFWNTSVVHKPHFLKFFPLHLVSLISVRNWNVIWFLFFFQIMRCTLDNDQYSLVVSHGWNVDIWCSRFGCVFQRLVCKIEPIKTFVVFLFGFVGDAVQAQFWSQTWIWHSKS